MTQTKHHKDCFRIIFFNNRIHESVWTLFWLFRWGSIWAKDPNPIVSSYGGRPHGCYDPPMSGPGGRPSGRGSRHVLHGTVPELCGDFKFDRGRPCDWPGKGACRDHSSGICTRHGKPPGNGAYRDYNSQFSHLRKAWLTGLANVQSAGIVLASEPAMAAIPRWKKEAMLRRNEK